jgi:hypothetical protein
VNQEERKTSMIKLPENVTQALLANPALGPRCTADGVPLAWPQPAAYLPPGFLPFTLFRASEETYCGYYWGIGRERGSPLICEASQRDQLVRPVASSLEAYIRLKVARGADVRECGPVAIALGSDVEHAPTIQDDDPQALLALDQESPWNLMRAAEECVQNDQLDQARGHYRQALRLLPEFGLASFGLAKLYRRQKDTDAAIRCMLDVLCGPRCFGGDSGICLQWVQRLPESAFAAANDPLWQQRRQLTLAAGVKYNADYLVYEALIEAYLQRGDGIRAARLRTLQGELLARETTAFRDRYNYGRERLMAICVDTFRRAGLAERLPTLEQVWVNKRLSR